jgi:uncharacterized short protein YbdD (DUF466 family)
MPDLQNLFDRSAKAAGTAAYWTTRAARLMVGVPDYETYFANASKPAMPSARAVSEAAARGPCTQKRTLGRMSVFRREADIGRNCCLLGPTLLTPYATFARPFCCAAQHRSRLLRFELRTKP